MRDQYGTRRIKQPRIGLLTAAVLWAAVTAESPVAALQTDRALNTFVAAPVAAPAETGIPVPPQAENAVYVTPTPAELRMLLQSSGRTELAAVRGLQAVVFRYPGPVADIWRWYRTTQITSGRGATVGTSRAQVVAGPRSSGPLGLTGIRQLTNEQGYLVVAVSPSPARPQELQVTVARVNGPASIVGALEEVPPLVERDVAVGRLGGRNADVAAFTFPGSKFERGISLPKEDAQQLLQQNAGSNLPGDVRTMYASLLRNAQSINLTTYTSYENISPAAFFDFYGKVADKWEWSLVRRDAKNPEAPLMLFNVGGHGTALIRAEPGAALVRAAPGLPARTARITRITLLILEGPTSGQAVGGGAP